MKKFIAMMVVALVAVSASAAQIKWGSSQLFNGDTAMMSKNGYATTAYLVYLAGGNWDSFDVKAFAADTSSALGTKAVNAMGTVSNTSGNYALNAGDAIPGTTDKVVDGTSTFGIIFLSSGTGFGDTKTYYAQSDAYVFSTTSPNYIVAEESFVASASVPKGSTWTAVPEPASAMLALAGVAMLIRRRK